METPAARAVYTRAPGFTSSDAVVLAAILCFFAAFTEPLAHPDTVRELLMAKDCAVSGNCLLRGPTSSAWGMELGAFWIYLLALGQMAGLGVAGLAHLLHLMAGAALLFLYLGSRRLLPEASAPTAVLVHAALLIAALEPIDVLWIPSSAPLPGVLFTLSVLLWTRRPAALFPLLIACLWLGFCIEAHLAHALLLPGFALLVALRAPRPATALPLLLFSGLLVFAVSPVTVTDDLHIAAERFGVPSLVGGAALLGALIGLALAARRRVPSLSDRVALPAAPLLLLAAPACVGLLLLTLVAERAWAPRYLLPALPMLSLLAALGLPRLRRALPAGIRPAANTLGVAVLLITILLPRFETPASRLTGSWTLRDVELMAAYPVLAGRSVTDGLFRIQGPSCGELHDGLAWALEPAPKEPELRGGSSHPHAALRALRLSPTAPLPGPGWVRPEPDGRLALSPIVSVLRRDGVERCSVVDELRRCAPLTSPPPNELLRYSNVAAVHYFPLVRPGEPLDELTWTIPVELPAGIEPRVLLTPPAVWPWTEARILAVDGVEHADFRPPARSVTLLSSTSTQRGRLTLGGLPGPYPPRGLMPCLMEASGEEAPELSRLLFETGGRP